MKDILQQLTILNNKNSLICQPFFYRLNNKFDKNNLEELLKKNNDLLIYDEIYSQIEEYVKSKNPQLTFSKEELNLAALKHLGKTKIEEYGVWVYYPWSKRLVHILDEKEFIEVRTNRNQNKITSAERIKLQSKKIGIIGLSVGQSIALTLALERGCGEIRIADFDVLELSNLNRIRSGLNNLGILKTTVVAREIAEIDPYLVVKCFNQGISDENIDEFLTKNGNLDILVDECDDLFIKILCRQKAKELKLPVIMDTSDRGMIDVERFDLEPERPILHGLIDHLDINKAKTAKTFEEKIVFVNPILGMDSISKRMKESMLQIKKTISTWPQLASSVVSGGGLAADV